MSIVDFKSDLSLSSKITDKPTNVAERKLDDIKRITNFTYGTTEGALFLAKQVGLQLTNPRRETYGGFLNGAESNRVFNLGVNLMAQTAVQGTGIHLDRHGLIPIQEERTKHYRTVEGNDNQGNSNLLKAYKRLIMPRTKFTQFDIGLNNNEDVVDSYVGGAGSIMGVGNTTIKRDFNTTNPTIRYRPDLFDTTFTDVPDSTLKVARVNYAQSLNLSTRLFTPNQLREGTGIDPDRPFIEPEQLRQPFITNVIGKPYYKAVRNEGLIHQPHNTQYVYPSGETQMKELGLDYVNKRVGFVTPNGDHNIDMVNITNIYSSTDAEVGDADSHDLVKFKVELIDNDNPTRTDVLSFRSYFNSFEDISSASMTPIRYVGRGDKFYVYDGYDASYSIGFSIYAMSAKEMQPIYNKLNYLKTSLAPDYSGTKMRASLCKVTFGNYLNRVPGFISSLNISLPEDTTWDVDIPYGEQGGIATELPRYLTVSLTFIPIYNHLVRKGRKVPLISVDKIGFLS